MNPPTRELTHHPHLTMQTLKDYSITPLPISPVTPIPTLPTRTTWYLTDLAEARGKQVLPN